MRGGLRPAHNAEMSHAPKPAIGSIGWVDLTVANADGVGQFYSEVTGWKPQGCDMGGYQDWVMLKPETGEGAAGVCHAREPNAGLPPVWLIYIVVADLDRSLAKCQALGGTVAGEIRSMGEARYCLIRDPAGAYSMLYQA